jgi:hypothetical protein
MTWRSGLDRGFAGVMLLAGSEGSSNLKYLTGNKEKQRCIWWRLGRRQDIKERSFRWSFLEIEISSSHVDNLVLVLLSIAICEERQSW